MANYYGIEWDGKRYSAEIAQKTGEMVPYGGGIVSFGSKSERDAWAQTEGNRAITRKQAERWARVRARSSKCSWKEEIMSM